MNDYYDPYNLQGCDPYKGMNDEERMTAGCLQGVTIFVSVIVVMLLCALLGSCTTTEYVPITETRTEHHWHTDSVRERDSTHTERETVIREVDSATMARYGIQMKDMQRAWLIETDRLQRKLSELRQAHTDTVHERDSILVPYQVIKEVPAQLSWWQQTRMHVGGIVIFLLIIFAAWKIYVTLHQRL